MLQLHGWLYVSFMNFIRTLLPATSGTQALLKEISSYEASVQGVEKKGQELVDTDHFAAEDISQQTMALQRQWRELRLLAGRRTQKLSNALEAQKVSQLWTTHIYMYVRRPLDVSSAYVLIWSDVCVLSAQ